jgi:3-isopropylmalate/(R)-2-methylmalate dehydratase large subunit
LGPENGITLPGATIVCGDSHTSTHGAFGAIAFGWYLEVEMVLSTQCIMQPKPRRCLFTSLVIFNWELHQRRCIIYHLKTIHFRRYWLFCGVRRKSFEDMTMEGRMTVCNLSIEMGARGGMIAPDQTTLII